MTELEAEKINLEEQRERMSTVGEMAAVLAHEIKNPMNSIIINLEVLRSIIPSLIESREASQKQKAEKYLDVIEGEMKRLDKVIKNILDLAAPPQPTRNLINLNHVIIASFDLLKLELEKQNIQVQLKLEEILPRLRGNADQIRQAILNILLNASQAMPRGGEIRISTSHDSKTLRLSIEDTGEGIRESIKDQIFSPYFTTKKKGSGLGLAIVRRILREHGGYVDLESEEGKGTCFHMIFPRSDKES